MRKKSEVKTVSKSEEKVLAVLLKNLKLILE